MKRIVAFIKPNMLDDVVFALHEVAGFPGASISEVQGIGSGSRRHLGVPDRKPFCEFPRSVRIEIVCTAATVEAIAAVIQTTAHTGLPDDGKIYISTVEDAIRIRTGERGRSAV